MWLLFALLAAVLWGVGQIFTKKGLLYLSPLFNNLLATLVALLVWIPFSLSFGVDFQLLPNIYPLALVTATSYIIYYYIIGKGQVSLTGTILATYPLTTVIISAVVLRETTTYFQKTAIALIILGNILIAIPNDKKAFKSLKIENWVLWAIFGAIIIGTGDFIAKIAITKSDAFTYLFSLALAFIPVVLITVLIDKKGCKIPKFGLKKYLPTIIGVTMIEIGLIPFNIAFSKGLASLVGPVSSSYVVITVILAYIFLNEKITKIHLLGVIVAVFGIILLGVV